MSFSKSGWNALLAVTLVAAMGMFAAVLLWQVIPVLRQNRTPRRPRFTLTLVQPSDLSTGQQYVLVGKGQGAQSNMDAFVQLPRGPSVQGRANHRNQLQALAVNDAPLLDTYENPNGSFGGPASAVWTWTSLEGGVLNGWHGGYMKWVAYPKDKTDFPGDVFISADLAPTGPIALSSGACSSTSATTRSPDGPCTSSDGETFASMTFFKLASGATQSAPFVTMSVADTTSPVQYSGDVTLTSNSGCVLERTNASDGEGSVFFIYKVTRV